MQVFKKDIGKGRFELEAQLTVEELLPSVTRAVEKISSEIKIEGFRPGKATYETLKQKIGEVSIWEEAARLAINKHLDKILAENLERQAIGQPQINITKLAPNNPLEFKIEVSVLPEVILGDYKDFGLSLPEAKIAETEIEKVLGELREMRVKEIITLDALAETNKALLDIQMYLDRVPVEGGQGQGVAVVLGKNFIVPGFDQKILGMKRGEIREFELHFPVEHHMKNLAGKLVEFKVTLKEVYKRELPELDEEFALTYGQKSVADLEKILIDNLKHEKLQKEEQKLEVEILEKMAVNAKFSDIPSELINSEVQAMLHELEHNLEHQGGNMADYLASLKKSREELMLELTPEALKRVKIILAIREVGLKEKLQVTEEEVDKQLSKIAKQYAGDKEIEARLKTVDYRGYVKNSLANQKIVDALKKWNIKK